MFIVFSSHWAVAKPLGIGKLYHTIEDNMKAAIKGDNRHVFFMDLCIHKFRS